MSCSNNFFVVLALIFTLGILACSNDPAVTMSKETKGSEQKVDEKLKEVSATLTKAVKEEDVKAEEAIIEIHLTDEEEEPTTRSSKTKINKKKESKIDTKKTASKSSNSTTKKGPKIVFAKSVHDFGSIKQGDEFQHRFKFENKGQEDLIISNVTASCGCTQPSYPFLPIKPGETGHIDVTYNSTGKMLTQKPTITVITNGSPRTHKLYLSGYVEVEMAKKPSNIITPDTTAGSH